MYTALMLGVYKPAQNRHNQTMPACKCEQHSRYLQMLHCYISLTLFLLSTVPCLPSAAPRLTRAHSFAPPPPVLVPVPCLAPSATAGSRSPVSSVVDAPSGDGTSEEQIWLMTRPRAADETDNPPLCRASTYLDSLPVLEQAPNTQVPCRVPHPNTADLDKAPDSATRFNSSVLLSIGVLGQPTHRNVADCPNFSAAVDSEDDWKPVFSRRVLRAKRSFPVGGNREHQDRARDQASLLVISARVTRWGPTNEASLDLCRGLPAPHRDGDAVDLTRTEIRITSWPNTTIKNIPTEVPSEGRLGAVAPHACFINPEHDGITLELLITENDAGVYDIAITRVDSVAVHAQHPNGGGTATFGHHHHRKTASYAWEVHPNSFYSRREPAHNSSSDATAPTAPHEPAHTSSNATTAPTSVSMHSCYAYAPVFCRLPRVGVTAVRLLQVGPSSPSSMRTDNQRLGGMPTRTLATVSPGCSSRAANDVIFHITENGRVVYDHPGPPTGRGRSIEMVQIPRGCTFPGTADDGEWLDRGARIMGYWLRLSRPGWRRAPAGGKDIQERALLSTGRALLTRPRPSYGILRARVFGCFVSGPARNGVLEEQFASDLEPTNGYLVWQPTGDERGPGLIPSEQWHNCTVVAGTRISGAGAPAFDWLCCLLSLLVVGV